MNHRQMVVANVQYKKPTGRGHQQTKGLLRYYTYRDGRTGSAIQIRGIDRWVDHGLGRSIKNIARRCDNYKSRHVLVWTLVINPNPELVQMVEADRREQFVRELTEMTLEQFFDARDIDTGVEYSYVIHHRNSKDKQSPSLSDPHAHILLPGTYFDEGAGGRRPLYFSRNHRENHIEMLRRSAEGVMMELMYEHVGPNWERDYDAILAERQSERGVVNQPPSGSIWDRENYRYAWLGTRMTDKDTSAVGYYRFYRSNPKANGTAYTAENLELEFRPFISKLPHQQAKSLHRTMEQYLREHPEDDFELFLQSAREIAARSPQVLEDMYAQQLIAPDIEFHHSHKQSQRQEIDLDIGR